MLAHIVLFFQPTSSAGRNGANENEDKCAPTVYSDIVAAISEHLKQSLVPKDSTQLQRSLQTLRLLALVLAQAGPPLWDGLLQTVADPLEELVTAGYSQLTLPLMDAVLAAYR